MDSKYSVSWEVRAQWYRNHPSNWKKSNPHLSSWNQTQSTEERIFLPTIPGHEPVKNKILEVRSQKVVAEQLLNIFPSRIKNSISRGDPPRLNANSTRDTPKVHRNHTPEYENVRTKKYEDWMNRRNNYIRTTAPGWRSRRRTKRVIKASPMIRHERGPPFQRQETIRWNGGTPPTKWQQRYKTGQKPARTRASTNARPNLQFPVVRPDTGSAGVQNWQECRHGSRKKEKGKNSGRCNFP